MAEWTDEQKARFAAKLKEEKEQQAHEAQRPDVGDIVEASDGSKWTVMRWATMGALDLRNDKGEELHSVDKDLLRVVRKASR